jgi:O-antigen/teichoic acid export membrane protein
LSTSSPSSPAGSPGPALGRGPFARRVAGVFATRVVQFAFGLTTSLVISRVLGPADKGAYVAVTTLPGMLGALGLFGLPSAVNYFAGRGHSVRSLIAAMLLSTAVLSIVLVSLVWVALPWLESSVLRAAPDELLRVMLITVPVGMLSSFGGTLLYGRQTVRTYNLILVAQSAAALLAAIVLVWWLHLGLRGAVVGSILVSAGLTVAVMVEVRRLGRRDVSGPPASIRSLVAYGLRLYPASVTGFFNYRADTYLIQALLVAAAPALGLYSIAVTMAELVFYVPDSVATMLVPRVAGATAADARDVVARVGRLTMLLSVISAVVLMPVVFVGIHLVLPAYEGSIPAFLVLLPGVVSVSHAKVMTSYLSGRARPGLVSIGAAVALVVNVALNLFLIPSLGIVGASLASVVSYTVLAGLMIAAVSRISGVPAAGLAVPGRGEVGAVRELALRVVARVRAFGRSQSRRPG